MRDKLKKYDKKDIYNLDETGLFFRYPPNREISKQSIKGTKKSKEKIIVLLCTNADGNDKRKHLVSNILT